MGARTEYRSREWEHVWGVGKSEVHAIHTLSLGLGARTGYRSREGEHVWGVGKSEVHAIHTPSWDWGQAPNVTE